MSDDGSKPLRPRLERFAQLLASPERRSAVECWCLSDASPVKPEPTPGREVVASRNQNRPEVRARVAHLRTRRAAESEETEIDVENVSALMERVTGKLLEMAELCSNMGLNELSQRLRRATILHAGRSEKLHSFVPVVEAKDEVDLDGMMARLRLCACATANAVSP